MQTKPDGSCVCQYKAVYHHKPTYPVYDGLNACIKANPSCTGQEKTQVWHRQDFSPNDPDWKPDPFNNRTCACIPGDYDPSKVNHGNLVACYQNTECKPIDDFWEPTVDNKSCVCQRASSPQLSRKYYGTAFDCSEHGGGSLGCGVPKLWSRNPISNGKCLCQELSDIREDDRVTYDSPEMCAVDSPCQTSSDVRYYRYEDKSDNRFYCTNTTQPQADYTGPYSHLGNCISSSGNNPFTEAKVDPEINTFGRFSCGVCSYDTCVNLKKDPHIDVNIDTGTQPGKPNLFMCVDASGKPSGDVSTWPIECKRGQTCCNIRTCDGRQDPCKGRHAQTESECIYDSISPVHSCPYYDTSPPRGGAEACRKQQPCTWTDGKWTKGVWTPGKCRLKSESERRLKSGCKYCAQNKGKGGHPLCVRQEDSC
jgi:hypothetical protein